MYIINNLYNILLMNKLDKEKIQKLAKMTFDSLDKDGEGKLSL